MSIAGPTSAPAMVRRAAITKATLGPRLEEFKRCDYCKDLLHPKCASGISGKKDDPIVFPHCAHALHAGCLMRWYYGKCTPDQQALLDRRKASRYARGLRQMALVSYDDRFQGRCATCAAQQPNEESAPAA